MNGDSKTDLVFTASSLNTPGTKLFYLANKSNSTFDFSNQTPQSVDFTFMSTENILITDVALAIVKEFANAKFDETVDVAINLGIDPAKSDQQVRGSTVMPNGTGKKVRVAVFTQGKNVDAAREAGADIVGLEDLAEKVKAGQLDFDVVIASPDAMRVVGGLGQILGPRGLMPNPKVGTVTPDVAGAVRNAKAGQVRYRCDKAGIVHCSIGKASFQPAALKENLLALIADLQKHKPSTSKGVYLQRVSVSSTMGPGLAVDRASLGA
jgi:large subunit ribosomal protein L1